MIKTKDNSIKKYMIGKTQSNGTKIPIENFVHKMGLINNGTSKIAIASGNSSNNGNILMNFLIIGPQLVKYLLRMKLSMKEYRKVDEKGGITINI